MAKARIDIVCDCCGEMFTVEKIVRNTDAKKSYEEWARKNITTCATCLKKQEIEAAVESGDAIIERMLYKDYKNEWATCKTVPDTYDAETKTIEVCISKLDRAWHDTLKELPLEVKNDEKFMHDWKLHFRSLVTHRPVIAEDAAPEWAVKVAEIVNNIYGC